MKSNDVIHGKEPRKGTLAHERWSEKVKQDKYSKEKDFDIKDNQFGNAKIKKVKEEFAGERVGQKPGDQVRGMDRAKMGGKQHPFKGRLVGEEADPELAEAGLPDWATDVFKQEMKPKKTIGPTKKKTGDPIPINNFEPEDIKNLETINDLATLKARAFALISATSQKQMKPEKVAWFRRQLDTKHSRMAVIKMMYDLLLSGEGNKVIGSKYSMDPNSYRQRFGEETELEEGWKSTLAGAALAGSLAFGGGAAHAARDLGDFSLDYLEQVVDGTIKRPIITIDDAKAELQQRMAGKKQTADPSANAPVQQATGAEYQQRLAQAKVGGRGQGWGFKAEGLDEAEGDRISYDNYGNKIETSPRQAGQRVMSKLSDQQMQEVATKYLSHMLDQGLGQRSAFQQTVSALTGKFKVQYATAVSVAKQVFQKLVGSGITEESDREKYDYEEGDDEPMFNDGDLVRLKPDYEDVRGEVFRVSQCDSDRGRCWIGDKQGRGWYARFHQLEKVEDNGDEDGDGIEDCPACDGRGTEYGEACLRCGGKGHLKNGEYDDELDESTGTEDFYYGIDKRNGSEHIICVPKGTPKDFGVFQSYTNLSGPYPNREVASEQGRGLDEAKHFRTAYGWAGGKNEKTGRKYKHPDQIKADREDKKKTKEVPVSEEIVDATQNPNPTSYALTLHGYMKPESRNMVMKYLEFLRKKFGNEFSLSVYKMAQGFKKATPVTENSLPTYAVMCTDVNGEKSCESTHSTVEKAISEMKYLQRRRAEYGDSYHVIQVGYSKNNPPVREDASAGCSSAGGIAGVVAPLFTKPIKRSKKKMKVKEVTEGKDKDAYQKMSDEAWQRVHKKQPGMITKIAARLGGTKIKKEKKVKEESACTPQGATSQSMSPVTQAPPAKEIMRDPRQQTRENKVIDRAIKKVRVSEKLADLNEALQQQLNEYKPKVISPTLAGGKLNPNHPGNAKEIAQQKASHAEMKQRAATDRIAKAQKVRARKEKEMRGERARTKAEKIKAKLGSSEPRTPLEQKAQEAMMDVWQAIAGDIIQGYAQMPEADDSELEDPFNIAEICCDANRMQQFGHLSAEEEREILDGLDRNTLARLASDFGI